MCAKLGEEFVKLSEELSQRIKVTTQEFFRLRGLNQQPNTSLAQMTTDLNQVGRELLMFGADVWPVCAICDSGRD